MKKILALFLLISGFIGLQGMCSGTGCCGCVEDCKLALLSRAELEELKAALLEDVKSYAAEREEIEELRARVEECDVAMGQCSTDAGNVL
jgi:hypothetical protein